MFTDYMIDYHVISRPHIEIKRRNISYDFASHRRCFPQRKIDHEFNLI